MNNLSKEALMLKSAIETAKMNLMAAAHAINELKQACVCEFEPLTQEQLDDEWMSEIANCVICGTSHGWRCKKSPDGVCHYFSNNGKVQLTGNRECDVPQKDEYGEDYDAENESDDWCIFCGHPDERK